jgi:hypothetical protein
MLTAVKRCSNEQGSIRKVGAIGEEWIGLSSSRRRSSFARSVVTALSAIQTRNAKNYRVLTISGGDTQCNLGM